MTLPSPTLTAASFAVAVVVGLTGMGGGALMTPILVFFFGIPPLTAVGSDLVVSAVTKPFGAVVHLRRGTVNLPIAGWMCIGSVPSAFSGVFLARLLGSGGSVQDIVAFATGVVLIIAAAAIGLKAYSDARRRGLAARRSGGPQTEDSESATQGISVRPNSDNTDRYTYRTRGGHDLGGFRIARHRRPHRRLPAAAGPPDGRHRPRSSHPDGVRGIGRAPHRRGCTA